MVIPRVMVNTVFLLLCLYFYLYRQKPGDSEVFMSKRKKAIFPAEGQS